jgi:NAD(P)-dependent dehydrogenase (short-subunit alcohol dehydrogenase family)
MGERPLSGQSAVITGGGSGIGRATAATLVGDGAHVLIAGRTAAKLEGVAADLEPAAKAAGGSIEWTVTDTLDEGQVRHLIDRSTQRTGRLDMAVAVPGGGRMAPVLRHSVQALEDSMRLNITGTYLLLRHAGSAMVRAGGGSFVAVSSMQAVQTAPMFAAYCAAKAGLEMLCRVAADELGAQHVRVNVVRPGFTRTDATISMMASDGVVGAYLEQQPIPRVGEAADIAGAIRYFLGPESTWTTGQCLTIDGGNTLRRFPELSALWQARLGEELDKAARGEVD